jgi:formylglycine-generating enzyme required for sulfatase activity
MEFVLIPAGEFVMGSPEAEREAALAEEKDGWAKDRIPTEGPQHKVKISRPFYLGKYEVTQAQWQAVMGNNPSQFQGSMNPVEKVSWDEVQQFLAKLNAAFERKGMLFGLPTEAGWEYACRAGTTTAFCFGDNAALLNDYGWSNANAGGKTHPVGQGKPNAWGLFDMHGNVWEWCSDWHAKDYYAQSPPVDPVGPPGGSYRVSRGGAWSNAPGPCRAAFRYSDRPGFRGGHLGFRAALVVPVDVSSK